MLVQKVVHTTHPFALHLLTSYIIIAHLLRLTLVHYCELNSIPISLVSPLTSISCFRIPFKIPCYIQWSYHPSPHLVCDNFSVFPCLFCYIFFSINQTVCSGILQVFLGFLMLSQGQTGFMGFKETHNYGDEVPFSSHHIRVHAINLVYHRWC